MNCTTLTLPAGTHICLENGNYAVTILPEKTFESRAQFDAHVRRAVRLLDDADDAAVREQYNLALVTA